MELRVRSLAGRGRRQTVHGPLFAGVIALACTSLVLEPFALAQKSAAASKNGGANTGKKPPKGETAEEGRGPER